MLALEVSSTGKKSRGRLLSILFSKPKWGLARVRAWLREHGYKPKALYEGPRYLHAEFAWTRRGDRIRTVHFGKGGIEARFAFRGRPR